MFKALGKEKESYLSSLHTDDTLFWKKKKKENKIKSKQQMMRIFGGSKEYPCLSS